MEERRVVTTISVSREVWAALRRLAERRAALQGGRPSASATIADLVRAASAKKREPRADA